MAKQKTEFGEQYERYLQLERDVIELVTLTEMPQFERIYRSILEIKSKCAKPAYEVENAKELTQIKSIYE